MDEVNKRNQTLAAVDGMTQLMGKVATSSGLP
jgi:hypothetical protein